MPFFATAQFSQKRLDSLHATVLLAKNDTTLMNSYSSLAGYYDDVNLDSSVHYSEKSIAIARQLQLRFDEVIMNARSSWPLMKMGNYPRVLKLLNASLVFLDNPASEKYIYEVAKGETTRSIRLYWLSYVHEAFSGLYNFTGNYEKAIVSANAVIRIEESLNRKGTLADTYSNIGESYFKLNKLDSALFASQKAVAFFEAITGRKYLANVYIQIGDIYKQTGDNNRAIENYNTAIQTGILYNNSIQIGEAHLRLASLFQLLQKFDSSLYHGKEALAIFKLAGKEKSTALAYRTIADCYDSMGKPDSSFVYLKSSAVLNDKIEKAEKKKIQEFQVAGFEETLKFQELEKEKIQTQNKIRTLGMLGGLVVLSIIGFILYRNNRQKQKANKVLETTLTNLKSAQSQLIQSEKMASLGELTAGIAHEIQNPLNFVNNFSEVSNELIAEMKDELAKGNYNDANDIANDVQQNLEKINHHGKRAADIVKGMLQHSRSSSGVKEPTDINALCDEYLRLSFHGLRAKDKSFNATMKTDFDESIGNINIIPQDIGRVVLNLLNNAFYAVSEKQKLSIPGYEPTIEIKTTQNPSTGGGRGAEISVSDNGNGIPQKVLDKIFQPFFTTKPTGQGTGLGLSLSYDIVKAHGGEIKVETSTTGSQFAILLPINTTN